MNAAQIFMGALALILFLIVTISVFFNGPHAEKVCKVSLVLFLATLAVGPAIISNI